MKYVPIVTGTFVKRHNRFLADCVVDGEITACHVPNTSRLTELLLPGNPVVLLVNDNPNRKTRFTIIHMKKGHRWVHIDSQAPNHILYEALRENPGLIGVSKPFLQLRKEAKFRQSRFDIFYETERTKGYIEIKGVTLEEEGVARFPGAPTSRGARHLLELAEAAKEDYAAHLVFVVQVENVNEVRIHREMDPAFGEAYDIAKASGVQVHAFGTHITPGEVLLGDPIPYE